jgi:predicted nucleic acid-binding protein
MDVVVDANVMFAAIIKISVTSKLFFEDDLHLFAPEFIFEELEEHKSELLDKTILPEEYFMPFLSILRNRISIVPRKSFLEFIELGKEISPDPDDYPYFALALKLGCGIWTQDKDAKSQQAKVQIFDTKDILSHIY